MRGRDEQGPFIIRNKLIKDKSTYEVKSLIIAKSISIVSKHFGCLTFTDVTYDIRIIY
jgi:hypothetical protein